MHGDPRTFTVPTPPQAPLPLLYEATADAADDEITIKRVERDGTLVGENETFSALDE